jgi:hypothetical protein
MKVDGQQLGEDCTIFSAWQTMYEPRSAGDRRCMIVDGNLDRDAAVVEGQLL